MLEGDSNLNEEDNIFRDIQSNWNLCRKKQAILNRENKIIYVNKMTVIIQHCYVNDM